MDKVFNKLAFGTSLRKRKKKETQAVEESMSEIKTTMETVEKKRKEQVEDFPPGVKIFSNQPILPACSTDEQREKQRRKKEEETACFRRQNRIFIYGDDIPDPINEFSDPPDVPQQLLSNLAYFGIEKPTPVQIQSIPVILARRELLASAPTGSGKTLAFVYPIIISLLKRKERFETTAGKLYALILEPTKELAKQVYMQFKKFSLNLPIECGFMDQNSSLSKAEILVSTPNKIAHLCTTGETRVLNRLKRVRWLIVDEADRLFDTTEGDEKCFRSQIARIYLACCGKYIRRAFFSATFSHEVEEWCKENLPNLAIVCVGARNTAVGNVEQKLVFTGSEHGKIVALRNLFRESFHPPVLIFVQTKMRARQLFAEMETFEPVVPCAVISSEQSDKERAKAVNAFREGKIWALICTEIMGRGLDLIGVNMIVNFDLPTSIISYIHRIGRAGRAGRHGFAISYFTEDDLDIIRPIANIIKQAGFPVPDYTLKLPKPTRNQKKEILRHAPKRKNITVLRKKRRGNSNQIKR